MANGDLNSVFGRKFRSSRRKVEKLGIEAGENLDKHFIKRLNHLNSISRFVGAWIALAILLIAVVISQILSLSGYYQHLRPVVGGTYTEGILGDFTNANPIYATTPVDTSVSRLVFSGLLKYDDHNKLVGDLASNWSTNDRGTVFNVYLRPNLTWQDGSPLTVQDVLFTYKVIQNPDAKSPLQSAWQGIKVEAADDQTIRFTLPGPLSSFPYSLTTGIIPRHVLGSTLMSEMRSTTFNTINPMGSGPFTFKAIEAHGDTPETKNESIELLPFQNYIGGKPKLDQFVIRAIHDPTTLTNSFKNKELTAISGFSSIPNGLGKDKTINTVTFPLTAEVMVFFKNTAGILNDQPVRQALITGTDTTTLLRGLQFPTIPVKEPFLLNQLGYNSSFTQANFNLTDAMQLLDKAGWVPGNGGIRYKNGVPLRFTLALADTPEYNYVASTLQNQWKALGVNLELSVQDDTNLLNTVNLHSYDALLYGISVGVDPDVFVYWDSTQFDPRLAARLNLSEYKSTIADEALEEGRTRTDPTLRTIKYKAFLQAWQHDAPALGLYQPRFIYITRGNVFGLDEHPINNVFDRYSNVQNWEIREARVSN